MNRRTNMGSRLDFRTISVLKIPYSDLVNIICLNKSPLMVIVSNSTASVDGYLNGWAHWCATDAKDCVILDVPKPKAAFSPDLSTKGYVEGNNKLPISSTNPDYIKGYNNAVADHFGIPLKIPTYNLEDFSCP